MIILMYHGVLPDSITDPCLTYGHIHVSAFERQIAWLRRNAILFSLGDCVCLISNGQKLPWNATVITFDDGSRNQAEIAFPILDKYRIPATFFITTAHIEQNRLLWFNYLTARAYLESRADDTAIEKLNFLHQLQNRYTCREPAQAVAADFDSRVLDRMPRDTLESTLEGMTKNQIYELAHSELVEIGGHTITHPRLTRCSPKDMEHEIVQSKHELERITGRKIRFFAYPEADQNPTVVEMVRKSGYEAAVLVEPVDGATNDLFRLPRVGIYRDSHWLFVAKWLRLKEMMMRAKRTF